MQLPRPRGPLTEALAHRLTGGPPMDVDPAGDTAGAPAVDEDLQLALWMLHAQQHRGFAGVDDRLERAPDLVALRTRLEDRFEADLRAIALPPDPGEDPVATLHAMVNDDELQRPELAAFVGAEATREQFVEFLLLRSTYHLLESDAYAFVLPRIGPGPKAALAELLYDEFGDGVPDRVHQTLFADALRAMDLADEPGAHVDRAPAVVLAESNAITLFALNRRLRGAALGHLAAFEATSSVPSRLIATGARRLELPEEVARYYDEHVEADAIHEQLALRQACGRLLSEEPQLAEDVLFGAQACLVLAERCGRRMVEAWQAKDSALLPPVVGEAA